MPLNPGTRLGGYEIIELIGAGGMGEVYRAHDPALTRDVAVKVLPAGAADDAERIQRFEQEARAIAALSHPNILTVYARGVHERTPYVVSELLAGEGLHARIRGGPIAPGAAVSIASQMARGLAAAHGRGIVHRDVKPANIFLTKDGPIKILDFGLAKLLKDAGEKQQTAAIDLDAPGTLPGTVMGTAGYMSPEQVRGQAVDHRSDIFSFGAVLYEMLAGHRAFQGETPADTMLAVLQHDPPALTGLPLSPALVRIVSRCLEKRADDRFQSTGDLAFALEALSSSEGTLIFPEPESALGKPPIRRPRRATAMLAAAAAVLAVAFAAVAWQGWRGRHAAATAVTSVVRSIAVLPFKPLVAGSGNAALELGMTDALITKLGNIRALTVPPTTAVLPYGKEGQDVRSAGVALGVEALVDGRLQTAGDRLRLTVQLIRTADGTQLWGEQFDAQISDLFAVQDSVSRRVAEALAVQLTKAEQQGLSRRYTDNVAAYQLYLQGRYQWRTFKPEGLAASLNYFRAALELDPKYALAYAGLATSYSTIAVYGPMPARDAGRESLAAARQAVALDEQLGEAHVALGVAKLLYEWDWEGAGRALERGLQLDPDGLGHTPYSYYLYTVGRFDEAIAEARRTVALNPGWPLATADLLSALYFARRYDEALAGARQVLALNPNDSDAHSIVGQTLTQQGRHPEAIAALQRSVRVGDGNPRAEAELGFAYAAAGDRRQASAIVAKLTRGGSPLQHYLAAEIFAGLGDRDRAFAWLDRAYDERFPFLCDFRITPQFDSLRLDPRYLALARRMKLVR